LAGRQKNQQKGDKKEMKNGHSETRGRQTKKRKIRCILHEFLQWSNLNGKNELKSGLFIYLLAKWKSLSETQLPMFFKLSFGQQKNQQK
jgi:hypothetical protein